jgi:hypothetical protein
MMTTLKILAGAAALLISAATAHADEAPCLLSAIPILPSAGPRSTLGAAAKCMDDPSTRQACIALADHASPSRNAYQKAYDACMRDRLGGSSGGADGYYGGRRRWLK